MIGKSVDTVYTPIVAAEQGANVNSSKWGSVGYREYESFQCIFGRATSCALCPVAAHLKPQAQGSESGAGNSPTAAAASFDSPAV